MSFYPAENPNPRYASADHLHITVDVVFNGNVLPYMCSGDDAASHSLFERAVSGEFGAIAAYIAPVISFSAELIASEQRRRFAAGVQGKSGSLMREAIYLQNIASHGTPLTSEQLAEVVMFNAINDWETALIDVREALIAAQDTATYALDETWPAAPAGLPEFLNGF